MPYANKADAAVQCRKYQKEHPEKVKEYQRRAYLKRSATRSDEQRKYNREYQAMRRAEAKAGGRPWSRVSDKRRQKDANLKFKYGITVDHFDTLFQMQEGLCKICAKPQTAMVVDHNHVTGKVRGLLCSGCNNAVGYLEKRIMRVGIETFTKYLETKE